jgi:hypothetical protein
MRVEGTGGALRRLGRGSSGECWFVKTF